MTRTINPTTKRFYQLADSFGDFKIWFDTWPSESGRWRVSDGDDPSAAPAYSSCQAAVIFAMSYDRAFGESKQDKPT